MTRVAARIALQFAQLSDTTHWCAAEFGDVATRLPPTAGVSRSWRPRTNGSWPLGAPPGLGWSGVGGERRVPSRPALMLHPQTLTNSASGPSCRGASPFSDGSRSPVTITSRSASLSTR